MNKENSLEQKIKKGLNLNVSICFMPNKNNPIMMIFIRLTPLPTPSHPKISLFPNLIENLLQSLSFPFQTLFLDQNKTIGFENKNF